MTSVSRSLGVCLLARSCGALAGAGCADDVPSPSLVEDLRVLAIRAEPPELLVDRQRTARPTGPAGPVSFQALVVDPARAADGLRVAFLPGRVEPDLRRLRRAPRPGAGRVPARAGRRPRPGDAGQAGQRRRRMADAGVGTFDGAAGPALFGYHLVTSGLGLGNGAWASAVLELAGRERDPAGAKARGAGRPRSVGIGTPSWPRFGWQVCPPPPAVALPGCLPLRPRTANQQPGDRRRRGGPRHARRRAVRSRWPGPLALAPGREAAPAPGAGARAPRSATRPSSPRLQDERAGGRRPQRGGDRLLVRHRRRDGRRPDRAAS